MNQPASEEDIRHYCQEHRLSRPKVNLIKATAWALATVLACTSLPYVLCRLTDFHFWTVADISFATAAIVFAKPVMVFAVKCWQRYAPESMRRQCSCMPSCSEYALLVLDMYPWPRALCKIWRRVTRTCAQPGYHFDYP